MPEMKLGTKFECYNCGTKFYDLGKSDALCPKCGADQKDAVQSDTLAVSQASRRRRKAEVVKPIDVEEEEPIGGEDFADEEMVAPDLGDDEEIADEEEDLDDEA
jgi:uncharacterized protein (TIGR02300 family)